MGFRSFFFCSRSSRRREARVRFREGGVTVALGSSASSVSFVDVRSITAPAAAEGFEAEGSEERSAGGGSAGSDVAAVADVDMMHRADELDK